MPEALSASFKKSAGADWCWLVSALSPLEQNSDPCLSPARCGHAMLESHTLKPHNDAF